MQLFWLIGYVLCCYLLHHYGLISIPANDRLGHREQKDEWAPRIVDVFTRHNVLPPNAIVSAGSANSACTAGRVYHLLAAAFTIFFWVCCFIFICILLSMFLIDMNWDIILLVELEGILSFWGTDVSFTWLLDLHFINWYCL